MSDAIPNKDLSFDFDFLDKLVVGIGEVSQITGIPTRQIRYWEEKNIIESLTEEEGKNRRYNYENIKNVAHKRINGRRLYAGCFSRKSKKRMEMIEETLNKLKQNPSK